ncbi:MAG: hypothetical protein ACRD72_00745 [Candidatus Angelobacter sp.]
MTERLVCYDCRMSKPEPILPEKESKILLAIYENPDKSYDTSYMNDMLHFPDLLVPFKANVMAVRGTQEYTAAFKETLKTIESLVEKGLIDGEQVRQENWGMYYKDLKVRTKGKQAAIREKRRSEELEKQMPEFLKRADEVAEEIRKSQERK